MKRFAKIILVILAAVAGGLVVALIGINLYLQSGDVQQRIRLVTEQALGTPVTVNRTIYTPWGGLTLSGLSLPDPTVPGAKLVDAPTFSVRFEFFPLLGKKFVISEVSLSGPHLMLRQAADRRWLLIPPRVARPTPGKVVVEPGRPAIRLPNYSVELRRFTVDDGRAEIIDLHGDVIGRLAGLALAGTMTADRLIQGDLEVDSLEIGEQLYPRRFKAHFKQDGPTLSITGVRCSLADGRLHGELYVVTKPAQPPEFYLSGNVTQVSIPKLLSEASRNDSGTSGTLGGQFKLQGNPLDAASIVGHGEFSLDAAQLRPMEAIQTIGMLLRIDELQMLKLRQASLRVDVHDQKAWLTGLTLKTDNLIIDGKGPVRFDGKMNLSGRLMVNQKIQHELGGLLGDNFTASEDANYKQLTFKVTGRLDRPKTDLIERVTGIQLGNVGGMIKGFFGSPPSSSVEATPAPAAD